MQATESQSRGETRKGKQANWPPSLALITRKLWHNAHRLSLQVSLTGQPENSCDLERLGFYCDMWAALRAGPTTAPSRRWTFGPTDDADRIYGPRYEPDRLPLDLLASGPTTLIHNESPWSLQPERASRLRPWGKVSADQSLRTAGRRDPIGPAAAVSSGPGRSKGSDSDQDQSRMERVEGAARRRTWRAEPGRAGTADMFRERGAVEGHAPRFRWDAAPLRGYPL